MQLFQGDVFFPSGNSEVPTEPQNVGPGRSGKDALERRGADGFSFDPKQIRGCALDDMAIGVQKDGLVCSGLIGFSARQDLVQFVRVLERGDRSREGSMIRDRISL